MKPMSARVEFIYHLGNIAMKCYSRGLEEKEDIISQAEMDKFADDYLQSLYSLLEEGMPCCSLKLKLGARGKFIWLTAVQEVKQVLKEMLTVS